MRISDWSSDVCSSDLKHVFYQVYDVTKLIRKGENALGVIVGDGWYAGAFGWRMERYGFGPAPRRLRAQLRLDYADRSHEWVVTLPDWPLCVSTILKFFIDNGEPIEPRSTTPCRTKQPLRPPTRTPH